MAASGVGEVAEGSLPRQEMVTVVVEEVEVEVVSWVQAVLLVMEVMEVMAELAELEEAMAVTGVTVDLAIGTLKSTRPHQGCFRRRRPRLESPRCHRRSAGSRCRPCPQGSRRRCRYRRSSSRQSG